MKNKKSLRLLFIIIFIIFNFFLGSGVVFSQSVDYSAMDMGQNVSQVYKETPGTKVHGDPQQGKEWGSYESFNELKIRITKLLEDNARLKSQQDKLKKEFFSLNNKAGPLKQEVAGIDQDKKRVLGHEQRNKQRQIDLEKERQTLENQKLLFISRINYLKGEIMDFDAKQKDTELKKRDLEYARREAQMDLRQKESALQQAQENKEQKLKNLSSEIEQAKKRGLELSQDIKALKNETMAYPETIQKLMDENNHLSYSIEESRIKKVLKEKEVLNLKDKRLLAEKMKENALFNKREESSLLEAKVKDLERQFNALNEKVGASLSNQAKAQELNKTIIEIDKENQDLRNQISQLQEQTSALQK